MGHRHGRGAGRISRGWLSALRADWASRGVTLFSATLMVAGQAAPAWAAASPRRDSPAATSGTRVTEPDKPGAIARPPHSLLDPSAVDLGAPTAELADSIATTSPAGAKEL